MDGDRLHGLPELLERAVIELDVWQEPSRAAANDRERERQTVPRRAYDRLGTPADADPCPQLAVLNRRVDLLVRERGPCLTRPRDRRLVEQLHEQFEFLLEQLVVVREVVAKKRIGLSERSSAENHFRAPVRDRVERREPLKHSD